MSDSVRIQYLTDWSREEQALLSSADTASEAADGISTVAEVDAYVAQLTVSVAELSGPAREQLALSLRRAQATLNKLNTELQRFHAWTPNERAQGIEQAWVAVRTLQRADNDLESDSIESRAKATLVAQGVPEAKAIPLSRAASALFLGMERLEDQGRILGPIIEAVRNVTRDGEFSQTDRAAIRDTVSEEFAKLKGQADGDRPWRHGQYVRWAAYQPETLTSMALDLGEHNATYAERVNTSARSMDVPIAETPAETERATMSAVKNSTANQTRSIGRFTFNTSSLANAAAQLLKSENSSDHVRGNLVLRNLVGGNERYSYSRSDWSGWSSVHESVYNRRGPVGQTGSKAEIARKVVAALSDKELSRLDPASAVYVVFAMQRVELYREQDYAETDDRGNGPSQFYPAELGSRFRDSRIWQVRRGEAGDDKDAPLIARVIAATERELTWEKDEEGVFVRVSYLPAQRNDG